MSDRQPFNKRFLVVCGFGHRNWSAGRAAFAGMAGPPAGSSSLIFVIVLQQIENNLLAPFVIRSQVDISPLLVLLAVFIGGSLGGLLGVLVAIPSAAALSVVVKQVIAPAVHAMTEANAS